MYTYRGYLGWITDLASQPHPTGAWPVTEIDEALLADYEASFAMQAAVGLDISSIWGLAVGRSWPLAIEESVDAARTAQVRRLIERAHRHGIRILAGTGVYSWGFEAIIREHPELSGGNPRAMCASNPDAWPWMRRVLDFVGDGLGVDGFSFQSADQGRCSCSRCAQWQDVEYHARLNARVTAYVREKWPTMLVAVNGWGMNLADPDDLPQVIAMTRHADYLIDSHSSAAKREPTYRRRLIEAIAPCAYGSVGGPFVEPPQHWERTRWFLPCLDRAARHATELYAEGGRAMEIFFHIQANPGDEVSVRHVALLLRDPARSSDDVLEEVLTELYAPRDERAMDDLMRLFRRADAAYFDRATNVPASATLSMEPLVSDRAGPPIYLTAHLDAAALEAYRQDIAALLAECPQLIEAVGQRDRVKRIARCLRGVLADIAQVQQASPAAG
jgi:hypothetical protein